MGSNRKDKLMVTNSQKSLLADVKALIKKYGSGRGALLSILRGVQKKHHFVSAACIENIAELLKISQAEIYSVVTFYSFLSEEKPKGKFVIRLCRSICCHMQRNEWIAKHIEEELNLKFGETSNDGRFTLEWTNCLGVCGQAPAMMINERVFTMLNSEKITHILRAYKDKSSSLEFSLDDVTGLMNELTFAAIKNDIGVQTALSKNQEEILALICASGLRGCGGAGFPVGVKWNKAAKAKGRKKYIICNADEGEPGAFKDRVILTKWPELVVEGMIIAAYAVGAQEGFIYLRGEYAFLESKLEECIERYRDFLGKNVRGKRGEFDLHIRMGTGSYVWGEETALIESLEGKRGEAREKPPHPVIKGLNGYPTVINNVETFAWVTTVLVKGTDWFKSLGTSKSPGSKLFSVAGDVKYPGVYEFPWGVSINSVLKQVGGEEVKAIMCGASGCFLSASQFNRVFSYEDVTTSGAIIAFGAKRNILDVTENLLAFFADESCGQCTPCRLGIVRLLEGVRKSQQGETLENELNELAETILLAAKCGLGKSAAKVFLSMVSS